MLTAHNGQLASFVCVMSYVFKFSIAYIHVYNDEKKPWFGAFLVLAISKKEKDFRLHR